MDSRAQWDAAYIDNLPDSAFAYIESGGEKDGEGKTTPRSLRHFPHHDESGKPDPAHVRNALARIPQSSVSDSAKSEAEAHVEKHAKALGIGEEKSEPAYERRAFSMELRAEERHRGQPPTIVGHAAVFDQTADIGPFRERIAPGAFARTIREGGPVYALWNHNPDFIIASTVNKTLRLSEDARGLLAEMEPLDTPTIRDMVVRPIQEGMVNKMSFGFESVRDDVKDGVRILRDLNLFDVSPVTFPAYSGTDVSARRRDFLRRIQRATVDPAVSALIEKLDGLIDQLMAQCGMSDETEGATPTKPMKEPMRSVASSQERTSDVAAIAGAIEAEARARRLSILEYLTKGTIHA